MGNNPLFIGTTGTVAIQTVNAVDLSQAVNLVSTIVIAIVTLFKLLKKDKTEKK